MHNTCANLYNDNGEERAEDVRPNWCDCQHMWRNVKKDTEAEGLVQECPSSPTTSGTEPTSSTSSSKS